MTPSAVLTAYLVAYDVRDPKRLRKVHKALCGYGSPVQYSIFSCNLPPVSYERMIGDLLMLIDTTKDRVLIVDLGPVAGRATRRVRFLGRSLPLHPEGPTIV